MSEELENNLERETLSNNFTFVFDKIRDLKYGENPSQSAALYTNDSAVDYEVMFGKELSYNNILDISVAAKISSEFYDVNCAAIVKHSSPCAVALGKTLKEACEKALDCDPISVFGSSIAFTKTVDTEMSKLLSQVNFECILAPGFEADALNLFKNKTTKLVKLNTPLKDFKKYLSCEIEVTPFGTLIQENNSRELTKDSFNIVTKLKPTTEQIEDMVFAWKIVKHAKTSAIVVAKDFKAIGIAQGMTNRIDAVETALNRACDSSKDAVLASDGAFLSVDNVLAAAQGRIKAIIQTGGDKKDKEIIACANKYEITMIMTGIRHFKH
ncbi:hypothetical protein IKQ26_04575 [bacterium]|nr:hypothetical protein [bacterium]